MQTALAGRFIEVDYGYISQQNIGILADLSLRCVGRSAGVFHSGLSAFDACIGTLIYGAFMLGISWYLTIGVVFAGIVISFVNGWAVRSARRSGVEAAKEETVVGGFIHALLTGARIIRSYGQEENEKGKFKSLQEGIYKRRKRKSVAQNITGPTSETASIVAIVIVLIIGSEVFEQTSLATMAVFAVVMLRALPKVAGFNRSRALIASEFTYVEQVVGWLEETRYLKQPNGNHVFEALGEQIKFKQVSFKYSSRNEFALNGINLEIPRGKVTAIVGPSGGGKSTLLDLILRFYDPTSGNIEIDGRDLRELDVRSWRSRIGVVSQEGFLFNDSLRANIGYGKENATIDEIESASRQAHAYDFIKDLPQQFDTIAGERGTLLSGGQQQRLVIARAIIRNPDILIFDEATSELDTTSERLIHEAIKTLSHNRTVIIVAHRLSTIRDADQIVVVDMGRIVEQGTHQDLMNQEGVYFALST
jgi:ABC-type multidrug transport system fused ATPase/permease subunit